jgi:hypothetical protein
MVFDSPAGAALPLTVLPYIDHFSIHHHLYFLQLAWDHMRWDVSQVFLNLVDLLHSETWRAWSVIHLEVFYFFELGWFLPANSFCRPFLFLARKLCLSRLLLLLDLRMRQSSRQLRQLGQRSLRSLILISFPSFARKSVSTLRSTDHSDFRLLLRSCSLLAEQLLERGLRR